VNVVSNTDRILVFIEITDDNKITPASLEAICAGRMMADRSGYRLAALIAGSNILNTANYLRVYGLDEIYALDNPLLYDYNAERFLFSMEKACQIVKPKIILMADTLLSKDLAPRVAFRLDTALVTDCVDIQFESGTFSYFKPVYSGNVVAVFSTDSKPEIAVIRSRVYEAAKPMQYKKCEIIPLDIKIDSSKTAIEILERLHDGDKETKLTSADIIVSGGRGIGSREGFHLLHEFASILNAGVAASRPPCDLGWVSPKSQVGLTGEIVTPSVYFAIGISGSTQHLAGMNNSKTVVAINKDPEAQIFKIADYGVVGNYEGVLPSLIKEIKEFRNY
jgi:electron transfer flavoprotein alpha subunit